MEVAAEMWGCGDKGVAGAPVRGAAEKGRVLMRGGMQGQPSFRRRHKVRSLSPVHVEGALRVQAVTLSESCQVKDKALDKSIGQKRSLG